MKILFNLISLKAQRAFTINNDFAMKEENIKKIFTASAANKK